MSVKKNYQLTPLWQNRMASALTLAAIPVGGAASLAIMAIGYYGRLQGATAQLAGVDAVRLQKEKALSQTEEKIAALQVEGGAYFAFSELCRRFRAERFWLHGVLMNFASF
jgi:UTP:GlnB (protein PII) uridylyltransferase